MDDFSFLRINRVTFETMLFGRVGAFYRYDAVHGCAGAVHVRINFCETMCFHVLQRSAINQSFDIHEYDDTQKTYRENSLYLRTF